MADDEPGAELIECHYPLINRSNQTPVHFLQGFTEFLSEKLDVAIQPTEFRGDIHLSEKEKSWMSQVHEIVGTRVPFWIIVSGGKYDFTAKWWDPDRYQQVVDAFAGRLLFVQVGERRHYQPPLLNVIDLRGKTSIRQLVRLVHHAQGVLCGVTFPMHLAAAVPVRGKPRNRPCVVVAGGREPPHWEAYPHHQFIHTVGSLRCCDHGGCWRARAVPLGDGDKKDLPESLCVDPVGKLPRCMDMITAPDVVRRIEMYFSGGAIAELTRDEAIAAQRGVEKSNTANMATAAYG